MPSGSPGTTSTTSGASSGRSRTGGGWPAVRMVASPLAQVEGHHLRGDERRAVELLVEHVVHVGQDRGAVEAAPAAGAERADGEVGEPAGSEAVAHRVEDRDRGRGVVDRVVEGVTGHAVGRLQDPGHGHERRAERERRQHRPAHLRGQRHRPASSNPRDEVAVLLLRHHQLAEEGRDRQPVVDGVLVAAEERQHPDPLGGVEDRQPEAATRRASAPAPAARPGTPGRRRSTRPSAVGPPRIGVSTSWSRSTSSSSTSRALVCSAQRRPTASARSSGNIP